MSRAQRCFISCMKQNGIASASLNVLHAFHRCCFSLWLFVVLKVNDEVDEPYYSSIMLSEKKTYPWRAKDHILATENVADLIGICLWCFYSFGVYEVGEDGQNGILSEEFWSLAVFVHHGAISETRHCRHDRKWGSERRGAGLWNDPRKD